MWRLISTSWLLFVGTTAPAMEVSYVFRGTVVPSIAPAPWQIPVPAFSSVKGVVTYDLDSPVSHDLGECDCAGFRQRHLNGFFAQIGNLSIRADDYLVEVLNDHPQIGKPPADIFSVNFSSQYLPPLEDPLVVNNTPRSIGKFSLNLSANSDLYSDAKLPAILTLADFHTKLGYVSDNSDGVINVLFAITSLTRIDRLTGDFDFDNDVDSVDFDRWKMAYGSTGDLAADGNSNGIVDAADYTVWRDRFTLSASMNTAMPLAVPEATATVYLLISTVLMSLGLNRTSRLKIRSAQAFSL